MTKGLKNCPFCGSDRIDTLRDQVVMGDAQLICCDCGVTGPRIDYGTGHELAAIGEAKRQWNTRAVDQLSILDGDAA